MPRHIPFVRQLAPKNKRSERRVNFELQRRRGGYRGTEAGMWKIRSERRDPTRSGRGRGGGGGLLATRKQSRHEQVVISAASLVTEAFGL